MRDGRVGLRGPSQLRPRRATAARAEPTVIRPLRRQGPATEQRFPVIDAGRGIVVAVTLLHYLRSPQPSQMYVSEVFKVVNGRIVHIDNIGLMMQGTTTLGFVH